MKISKNITKDTVTFYNADETYNIKVKDDYSLSTSLIKVYDEIKNLLNILTNEKGKFYYKIESLITCQNTITNKKKIRIIKTFTIKHPSDLFELNKIICMLSRNFKKSIDPYMLSININIYYDYNKAKYDFDSDKNYITCIGPEDFLNGLIKSGSIPIKYVREPLIFIHKKK